MPLGPSRVLNLLLASLLASKGICSLAGIHRHNQCAASTWFQPYYNGPAAIEDDWKIYKDGSDTPLSTDDLGPYEVAPGHSVFSHYKTLGGGGGGVAEKYASERYEFNGLRPDVPVVQLEYTAGPQAIWYDLSFINCQGQGACIFRDGGYLVEFEGLSGDGNDGGKKCDALYCPKTDDQNVRCEDAYHLPDDLEGTRSCAAGDSMHDTVNMTVIFCPTNEQVQRYTSAARRRRSSRRMARSRRSPLPLS